MATTHYRCHKCGRMDRKGKFKKLRGEYRRQCPKPGCGEADDTFPWRKFRCLACRRVREQLEFFPGIAADDDPSIGPPWPFTCPLCGSEKGYEQVPIRHILLGWTRLEQVMRARMSKERRRRLQYADYGD